MPHETAVRSIILCIYLEQRNSPRGTRRSFCDLLYDLKELAEHYEERLRAKGLTVSAEPAG